MVITSLMGPSILHGDLLTLKHIEPSGHADA